MRSTKRDVNRAFKWIWVAPGDVEDFEIGTEASYSVVEERMKKEHKPRFRKSDR